MTIGTVFQASDLAGAKRREFLGAAREGGALLRDTDGFALTMVPLSQLEAITEVARTAGGVLRRAAGRASARRGDPRRRTRRAVPAGMACDRAGTVGPARARDPDRAGRP
jgi:hypothetical protein